MNLITGLATNFLLIESLQRFYQYYGDDLQVCNGTLCSLWFSLLIFLPFRSNVLLEVEIT